MIIETTLTDDGSSTLYRPDLDEHYHSVKGAATESRHVYIDCGLRHVFENQPSLSPVRILEIGFGTGLDAMLAIDAAIEYGRAVRYIGLETVPLDDSVIRQLGLDMIASPQSADFVTSAPWNSLTSHPSGLATIEKRIADATTAISDYEGAVDLLFMDAFAPEKQPELWTPAFIAALSKALAPGGVIVTYCAKGIVRRALKDNGLTTERLPGPPGGKREILRARKPS